MTGVNRIVWGILLVFGGFVVHESLDLSYYGSDFGPGPGFFSFWLGVLLIVLSLIQVAGTFRGPRELLPEDFVPGADGIKRMLCILGALVASLFLMKPLGFSLTMLSFCIFLFRTLGSQSWWLTLTLAVVGSFGLFYVFGLLQVILPTGLLGI
ncbi:MAG TPA: tripartite tricarboxylate transporter TctB family protein [Candidatus Methylomirabilis sp.]|nr:tripartite tricarboxylate transporter TctB family protein [Candidatus Methylomirabilis sp.]